jgi:hypothetical protein
MEKVLAIVVLVVALLVAIPHIKAGEWLAPTAVDPNSWITSYDTTGYAAASATPPEGYGWFRFDFWNNRSLDGRPVQKGDFNIRL